MQERATSKRTGAKRAAWATRWHSVWFRTFVGLAVMGGFSCGGGGCGLLDLGGCAGGGCSSCEGCESCGIEPLADGFPAEGRIENAAQARLTEPGLRFLEGNLGDVLEGALPDGLTIPIPRTEFSLAGTDYTLCPDEDCFARIELRRVVLEPTEPNELRATVDAILDARDPAGDPRTLPLVVDSPLIPPYTCDVTLDTRGGGRDEVSLVATAALNEETRAPRDGFPRLDVPSAGFREDRGIETADLRVSGCILGPLFNTVRPILIGEVESQIDELASGLAQQCTRPLEGADGALLCPGGTFPRGEGDEAVCRYEDADDADCVPALLGLEGGTDLGALLASISPGTHADVELLLAAAGEGEVEMEGMNVGFRGGFESPSPSACVPRVAPPELPPIPAFADARGDVVPGTGEPAHLALALAEPTLDQLGWAIFDGGMLCLGVGTSLSQQLESGLFSLVAPSLRNLTFPETSAPLAIALRPQQPPDFTVGVGADEPLLSVALPALEMDFYVFSHERYVRFATFRGDLTLPVDLVAEDGALVPMIGTPVVENPEVLNSDDLLTETPMNLARAIAGILEAFAGMIGGSIDPIALPEVAGVGLEVPDGGLTGIEQDGERALGIFARLAPSSGAAALTAPVETAIEVRDVQIDAGALALETWGDGRTRVELEVDARGPLGVPYEYAVRVDGMGWSRWQRSPRFLLEDRVLLFEARHRIEARARVVGEPGSVDPTPAEATVIVDVQPPLVRLEDGRVIADDLVSGDRLEVRFDGGAWEPYAERMDARGAERVEVRDEAGHVASATQGLIRGRANPSADAGCACRAAAPSDLAGALPLLAVLALLRRRRGRRS